MPTYTVHAPAGVLGPDHKRLLAREITRAHNEATGAQTFFAQVLFFDRPAGDWFVGGAPLEGTQVYVHGHVRAGRSPEVKTALVVALVEAIARASGCARNRVWVSISEVPAEQMAEYGQVLPQPGGEAAWVAALPAEDRLLMESIAARGCF